MTITSGVPPNVAVLTICDEHDCQFLQFRHSVEKHLNLFKAAHEVRTTTSTDITDLSIEGGLVVEVKGFTIAVVEISVELLKWTFFSIKVFFTDNLSTKFECLNGCARHGA